MSNKNREIPLAVNRSHIASKGSKVGRSRSIGRAISPVLDALEPRRLLTGTSIFAAELLDDLYVNTTQARNCGLSVPITPKNTIANSQTGPTPQKRSGTRSPSPGENSGYTTLTPVTTNTAISYIDGVPTLDNVDLASNAFGTPFGHTRSFSQRSNALGNNGNGWNVVDIPYLALHSIVSSDEYLVAIDSGRVGRFFEPDGGDWKAQDFHTDTLTFTAADGATPGYFTRIDADGNRYEYYDLARDGGGALAFDNVGAVQTYTHGGGNVYFPQGAIKSFTTREGVTTTYAYEQTNTNADVPRGYLKSAIRALAGGSNAEKLSYTYSPLTNANYASTIVLDEVEMDIYESSSWVKTRTVSYDYYLGTGSKSGNGRLGDLELATIRDWIRNPSTGDIIDQKYYRYAKATGVAHANYTQADGSDDITDSGGPTAIDAQYGDNYVTSVLRIVAEGEAFARMAANYSDYDTRTDAEIRPYVNRYFRYERWGDSAWNSDWDSAYHTYTRYRVIEEAAQGIGCSACSDGIGNFKYTYTLNTSFTNNTSGFDSNVWRMKTIEYLPDTTNEDGNVDGIIDDSEWDDNDQVIAYTNEKGQVMLRITIDKKGTTSTGDDQEFYQFYRYDSEGRVVLTVDQSGISGYDDGEDDLMDYDGGVSPYLVDSSGLFQTYAYGSSTTGGLDDGSGEDPTFGDVLGYESEYAIKNGETGTSVPQRTTKYFKRTVGDVTVYPVANVTTYRETNGTGGRTTSYGYEWYSSSIQPESITTTNPIASTGQNGSNSATSSIQFFDHAGRETWSKDEDGFIFYTEYFGSTGAVKKSIVDVDTDAGGVPGGLPYGWSNNSGLNLTTTYEADRLGRTTKVTDPNGLVTFIVYKDLTHEVRVYPGWTGSTTTGPIQVSRTYWPESGASSGERTVYHESILSNATPSEYDDEPTGTETIDESNIVSLTRELTSDANQIVEVDTFTSMAGITYASETPDLGTAGTNYLATFKDYASKGLLKRTVDPDGTITRYIYDGRRNLIQTWQGTDDSVSEGYWAPDNQTGANMVLVSTATYDVVGNRIQSFQVTANDSSGDPTASYVTNYFYDWRHRLIGSRGEDKVATKRTLNNLGESTQVDTFADSDTDFTIDAGELRSRMATEFDERGQPYQTTRYEVDPASGTSPGTVGDSLTTNYWRNARGQVIKTSSPLGLFSKTLIDGAGRTIASYTSFDDDESYYAQADDINGDFVIEQSTTLYDGTLPIVQTTFKHTSDSPSDGELSSDDSFIQTRVTWYDAAKRPIATANYGRDNGSPTYVYSSGVIDDDGGLSGSTASNGLPDAYDAGVPETPTSDSSYDYILTQTQYDSAGRVEITYDNKADTLRIDGIETHYEYDVMGRRIKMIVNYDDGAQGNSDYNVDKTTEWKYDTSGRLSAMVAYNSTGSSVTAQTTAYLYEDDVNRSLVTTTVYPDSTDTLTWSGDDITAHSGSDNVTVEYDRLGRKTHSTDQRGVVHRYTFDEAGRLQADAVTSLGGSGVVDGSIRAIERSYDDMSRIQAVTSYDNYDTLTFLGDDNIVNEVETYYDGWGNIYKSLQEHDGEVTGNSPVVKYIYGDGAVDSEAKYVRLEQVQYPNGRRLYVIYHADNTIGGRLVQPWKYADNASGSNYLADLEYIGASTIIREDRPVSVGLTMTVDYDRDGSLTGLDRFGRIAEMNWVRDEDGDADFDLDLDSTAYTYDRNSNRLTREVLADSVPSGFDQGYTYDDLNRLTGFESGTLDGGSITSENFTQSWNTLDNLGNWKSFSQDADGAGGGSSNLSQSRSVNSANELTGISGDMNWEDPVYDAAGNMTYIPIPGDETVLQYGIYDAWNHLVALKVESDPDVFDVIIAEYEYDGLGRRIEKMTDTITGSNATEHIYFNEQWQILETRVSLQTYEQFTWDPKYIDAPIARYRNANIGTVDGALDTSFDSDGKVSTDFGGGDLGQRVAIQPDGKIVVVGHTDGDFAVARYNLDGSLDDSFGTDGLVIDNLGGADQAFAVAITFDGKILVAGGSDTYSAVVRYNKDGTRDTGFGTGGLALINVSGDEDSERFFDIQIDSQGRIVLAGQKLAPTNGTLVRISSGGSLDSSFDSDGILIIDPGDGIKTLRGIAIDSEDRIVVTGEGYDTGASQDVFAVARFEEDGSYDDEFGTDGVKLITFGTDDDAYSVAIDAEGRIVVAGDVFIYDAGENSDSLAIGVVRLLDDGSLDASFSSDGKAFYNDPEENERGRHMVIDALGNILVAGSHDDDLIVVRFKSDGSLDGTFSGDGVAPVDLGGSEELFGLAIQLDGKIVAVGGGDSDDFELIRLLAGTNEHTFYTYDANYNVTATLDRYGNVVERYTYTPYGKRTILEANWSLDGDQISDIKSNFGHQGGLIDGESLLMKFRYRDYHASLGNWIEPDPLEYAAGDNLYEYVLSNPTVLVDPTGLAPNDCTLTAITNIGPWTWRGNFPGTALGPGTAIAPGIFATVNMVRAVYTRLVQYLWVCCDAANKKYYKWGDPQAQKGWAEPGNPALSGQAITGTIPIPIPLPYGQTVTINITYGAVWAVAAPGWPGRPAQPTTYDPMPVPQVPAGKNPVASLHCGCWSNAPTVPTPPALP